jgi:hypothetical protein
LTHRQRRSRAASAIRAGTSSATVRALDARSKSDSAARHRPGWRSANSALASAFFAAPDSSSQSAVSDASLAGCPVAGESADSTLATDSP